MVPADLKSLWRDESGSSMLEVTAVMTVFLLILFGVIEFSFVFYQWNAATKAVQHGARMAAVSNPVANDLMTMTGVGGGVLPGAQMPAFDRECTSNSASGATGTCTGNNSYNADAMQRIVFGSTTRIQCDPSTSTRDVGMCHLFERITPLNVKVRYQHNLTELGYAGRPCGPVPTITVSLTGLSYTYIFLNGLTALASVNLPGFATTVTGEDMNISGGTC